MKEQLISELQVLSINIQGAEKAVYTAHTNLTSAKKALQDLEDGIILGLVDGVEINGKNAEIRASQMREFTSAKRQSVYEAEAVLEAKRLSLNNLRTDLQVKLALVELVKKGVA